MCRPVIYLQNAYYRTLLMVLQGRAACFITDPHANAGRIHAIMHYTFTVHKADQTFQCVTVHNHQFQLKCILVAIQSPARALPHDLKHLYPNLPHLTPATNQQLLNITQVKQQVVKHHPATPLLLHQLQIMQKHTEMNH